jgi:nucleoid DNA-binding protein|tara:strand:- start:46 stop:237 length:192 start_codon:yes stop_codon:yes gene_type:complete
MNKKTLIRDLTDVRVLPKSQVKLMIDEYVLSILPTLVDGKTYGVDWSNGFDECLKEIKDNADL